MPYIDYGGGGTVGSSQRINLSMTFTEFVSKQYKRGYDGLNVTANAINTTISISKITKNWERFDLFIDPESEAIKFVRNTKDGKYQIQWSHPLSIKVASKGGMKIGRYILTNDSTEKELIFVYEQEQKITG